jgi:hypothetical protein
MRKKADSNSTKGHEGNEEECVDILKPGHPTSLCCSEFSSAPLPFFRLRIFCSRSSLVHVTKQGLGNEETTDQAGTW